MKKVLFSLILSFIWQTASAAPTLLLGINEGLAEQAGFSEMQEKYKGLAELLSIVLKKQVKIESSQNIKSSSANLQKSRYDLMFCRPSNVAAKAIQDQKYALVAMAKGNFTAAFIVSKDSSMKKPEDINGKRIAFPAETSLMTKAGLATLRDMNITPSKDKIKYTRFQDALAYMVKNKFTDAAVVAPIVAKNWEKEGGRVLFNSKQLPFWSIIASPNMSQDDIEKIRSTVIAMENSDDGKKILGRIGVKGFVAGNQQDYLDMLKWLAGKKS